MRYFVIEDGTDVSAYGSLESAVCAIEPIDVPHMRLFDEAGNEHALLVDQKLTRFMKICSTTIDSTVASVDSRAAGSELESILRGYAVRVGVATPSDAGLTELSDLIARHQGVLLGKPPATTPDSRSTQVD